MSATAPPPVQTVQVVDGDGEFNSDQVEQFVQRQGLAEAKTNYQIVAIMGPQSSGKSTLLNHVFGTDFIMMDALSGRSQTTKGIWLARSPKITDIATLVLDLEGSDGRERGEDDTNFERRSALFALAVADVLLINVWCHDVGREHASGKPLLKTIFQVNLKLFAPEPNRRRTVLLFVIRDKTRTPLPRLIETMDTDLAKMWETIAKPKQYADSTLTDFFEVQYCALAHYEEKYEDFIADANLLRRRFTEDVEDTLVRRDDKLPGDALCFSTRSIWDVIRQQKDLNLPAHKVMVANVRCAEIKEDQLRALAADPTWDALREAAEQRPVPTFGAQVASLLDSCLQGYNAEATYFDLSVRQAKGEELQMALLALARPLYLKQVSLCSAAAVKAFETDLRSAQLTDAGAVGFAAVAASSRAAVQPCSRAAAVEAVQPR